MVDPHRARFKASPYPYINDEVPQLRPWLQGDERLFVASTVFGLQRHLRTPGAHLRPQLCGQDAVELGAPQLADHAVPDR